LYLKSGPEILSALNKGVIDAGVISAPMTVKARQAGLKDLVDVPRRNIPLVQSCFGTTRDFLKEHRDSLRAFLQGYTPAIKFAKTSPEEQRVVLVNTRKRTIRTTYRGPTRHS